MSNVHAKRFLAEPLDITFREFCERYLHGVERVTEFVSVDHHGITVKVRMSATVNGRPIGFVDSKVLIPFKQPS